MTITALILAGGLGTRIRSAIGDKAKALAAVEGVTFLELFLGLLRQRGIGRVVLLTGYDAGAVEAEARRLSGPGFVVECVREDTPLGTGGAVRNALEGLPATEPFLVMNGDTWIDFDPAQMMAAYGASGAEVLIAATAIADCSDYGRLEMGENNRLLSFQEKAPGSGMVNAGIYVLTRDVVARFPQTMPLSIERDVFPALLAENRVLAVAPVAGPFYDIGTPDRLTHFRDLVRVGKVSGGDGAS